jgi:hypothetical protein
MPLSVLHLSLPVPIHVIAVQAQMCTIYSSIVSLIHLAPSAVTHSIDARCSSLISPQHFLAMSLMFPNDAVGVMVNDDGDVLVAFLIARLIDADVLQTIETVLWTWVRILPVSGDDRPDGVPCDPHVRDLIAYNFVSTAFLDVVPNRCHS